MAEPNVVTQRRGQQAGQAPSEASPSMPAIMNNDNKGDTLGPSENTRGRLDQLKAFPSRLSSEQPTVGNADTRDIEIPSSSVSTRVRSTPTGGRRRADSASSSPLPKTPEGTNAKDTAPRSNIITHSQSRQLRESFSMFPMLPRELRLKVWREAAPRYGLYPVQGYAKLESPPMPDTDAEKQSNIIALRPYSRTEWYSEFAERVRATRSLLLACRESRSELHFLFPDTVHCFGGELRFSGERDVVLIIFIKSLEKMLVKSTSLTRFSFANDWHKKVRKLGVFSPMLQYLDNKFLLSSLTLGIPSQRYLRRFLRVFGRFDEYRAGADHLRQLVIVEGSYISSATLSKVRANDSGQRDLFEVLRQCYRTDVRITVPPGMVELCELTPAWNLRGSLCALDELVEKLEMQIQGRPSSNPHPQAFQSLRFGYTELPGVEIVKLVMLDPALAHLCPEMEFN